MDRKTHRLFTVCHSEVMIILDSDNGKVIGQVQIGKGVDGVVFDPSTKQCVEWYKTNDEMLCMMMLNE